jgi:hypothetical protein
VASLDNTTNSTVCFDSLGVLHVPHISIAGAGAGTYVKADGTGYGTPSGGSGTVTTTGSPSSGNMAKFSGSTSITNATAGTDYVSATSGSAIQKASSGNLTAAAASDVVGLFSTCSGTQYLGADGACHTASGGSGSNAVYTTVSYSATPTFTVTASSTPQIFSITLTGNVTSSTLVTTSATAGQQIVLQIIQDGTGSRTFVYPSNWYGACQSAPQASYTSNVVGIWDGTNVTTSSCGASSTSGGPIWHGISAGSTLFSSLPSTALTATIAWICDNTVTALGTAVTSGSGTCGTGSAVAELLFNGSGWTLAALGAAPTNTVTTVTTLPAATAAVVGQIYRMTAATTANLCPTAGDSGGSGLSYCVSNGTTYTVIPVASGATGNIAFPRTVTVGTTLPSGAPTGTVGAAVLYSPNSELNAKAYGALGNGILLTDASMLAGGGELFTCNSACYPSAFIVDYSGTSGIDVSAANTSTSSTTITAPSVTTTHANDMLITIMGWDAATAFVAPVSPAQRQLVLKGSSGLSNDGVYVGDQIVASSGATGTVTASTNVWSAFSIALTPSSTVAYVGSSAANYASTTTIRAPEVTGANVGDLQILCLSVYAVNTVTITPPSGWTLITAGSGSAVAAGTQAGLYCYQRTYATISTGYTLTSASATFTSGDVGKLVCVNGAGLNALGIGGKELCAKIAAYTDANDVVLTGQNYSSSNISSQQAVYATDDSTSIAAAIAAACNNTLWVPAGIYGVSVQLAPCTTGMTRIKGAGSTLPNYENIVSNNLNGGSASAFWWLSKNMTAGTSGIAFGNGLSTASVAQGNANYRYPPGLADISLIAGVGGGNFDGGCSTCSGLYITFSGGITVQNIGVAGWGQDGVDIDGSWRAQLLNSFIQGNGRYGVGIANSNQNTQNLLLEGNDISFNGEDGVYTLFAACTACTLINNIIQWNVQVSGGTHYEVYAQGDQWTIVGNWFEKGTGNATNFLNTTNPAKGQNGQVSLVSNNQISTYTNIFSVSGCSATVVNGGATSGVLASGTTGTCTVTVTMGPAMYAPNGWACGGIQDLTTTTDTMAQTTSTNTTAVFTGTTVSGDSIAFACLPR